MMHVTLKSLRKAGPCFDGYNKLVSTLSGKPQAEGSYMIYRHDGPVSIETILTSNGLDDALWALRCVEGHDRDLRLYAVWCARQVQHLMTDPRSLAALDVAERYANGEATSDELKKAYDAACDATRAAGWAAARAAASDAAGAAARAAARAAASDAAWAATGAAARAAASDAAKAAQSDMLIKMCRGEAPWQGGQS